MARCVRMTALAAWACVAGGTAAQPVTSVFTYQGEVRQGGVPSSGVYDFRFMLFDGAAGGAQVGPTLCVDNLGVAEGRFAAELDFGAVFGGQQRFLEIQARVDSGLGCADGSGFATLTPRQGLSASPHAVWALSAGNASTAALATNASQLGGQGASFYQNAANLSSGALPSGRLTGTYSSAVSLTNTSNVFVGNGAGLTGLNASNLSIGALPLSVFPLPLNLTASASGTALVRATNGGGEAIGIMGRASAPAAGVTTGVLGQSDSPGGRGVQGLTTATSGLNYGGYFQSPSILGQGVYSEVTATTGSTIGGNFVSRSTEGRAVQGVATAASGVTYGGYFETESFEGVGVFGAARHYSGASVGGMFEARGTHGVGVFGKATLSSDLSVTSLGVKGESAGRFGQGVFGLATHPTGETRGGRFESQSTAGIGVVGLASGLTGETIGVSGVTYSNDGIAVLGTAGTSAGGTPYGGLFSVVSPFGVGVQGWANSEVPGVSYGVRGTNDSPIGFAVFAVGDMGATGVKPFRIDHPLDPENRYLLHYSAESPEVINFYSGNVVLDESGGARVEMPEYFASINTDPRYALTAVGAPMPMLHVSETISEEALKAGVESSTAVGCRFRIAGGVAGGRVSWEVKAVRNDLRMRLHGAPVEREKMGPEMGKLQHPGHYGQPREDGIDAPAVSKPRAGGAR